MSTEGKDELESFSEGMLTRTPEGCPELKEGPPPRGQGSVY